MYIERKSTHLLNGLHLGNLRVLRDIMVASLYIDTVKQISKESVCLKPYKLSIEFALNDSQVYLEISF